MIPPPPSLQAVLFTETIAHNRGEFFFDSRIVFESVFVVNFDPESVLQQQTLYSIQEVAQELEFIATNVSCSSQFIGKITGLFLSLSLSFSTTDCLRW